MGWSFDGSRFFKRQDPADFPDMIALRNALPVPGGTPSRAFFEAHGLRALPLVEWPMNEFIPQLFELLRERSSHGFMFDIPGQAISEFRKIALDEETAKEIDHRNLVSFQWIFVDNLAECIILPWYSDTCFFCLTPTLFERFLAKAEIDFSLDGDRQPALTFDDALRAAFQRYRAWGESWPSADPASIEQVCADFEWQLETQ